MQKTYLYNNQIKYVNKNDKKNKSKKRKLNEFLESKIDEND